MSRRWIIGLASGSSGEGVDATLLEVNGATVPTGVVPLHFGPAPARGVHHPSVVVEVMS